MWAKLFGKKEMETIGELEAYIQSILKKVEADFISIVGLKGKFKGLDILTVVDKDTPMEKNDIKRLNAKLAEYYLRTLTLNLLPETQHIPLHFISYYYTDQLQFHIIPFSGNDLFFMTTKNGNREKILKNLEKIENSLKILRPIESPEGGTP
jgi:hypothetical protein